MGIRRVGIDGGDVILALLQEIETDSGGERLIAGGVAYKPVVAAFRLAGNGDIGAGLCLQVMALIPVEGYILDELAL